MPRTALGGCFPKIPCEVPEHDECEFDAQSCRSALLGTNCSFNCRLPYVNNLKLPLNSLTYLEQITTLKLFQGILR